MQNNLDKTGKLCQNGKLFGKWCAYYQ